MKAAATRIGKMALLPQVLVPLAILTRGRRLLGRRGGSSPGWTKVLGCSVEDGFAFEGVVENLVVQIDLPVAAIDRFRTGVAVRHDADAEGSRCTA